MYLVNVLRITYGIAYLDMLEVRTKLSLPALLLGKKFCIYSIFSSFLVASGKLEDKLASLLLSIFCFGADHNTPTTVAVQT